MFYFNIEKALSISHKVSVIIWKIGVLWLTANKVNNTNVNPNTKIINSNNKIRI